MNQILQKAEASVARLYDKAELWADGIVHVVGVALAVGGAAVMLWYFAGQISPVIYISALIYVLSLVAALTISAIYNIWPVSPVKQFLRRFDHSMIYVLIAGTYTPFIMKMGEGAGWHLGLVWLIAFCGIALKLTMPGRFDRLANLLYLALGWSGVLIYAVAVSASASGGTDRRRWDYLFTRRYFPRLGTPALPKRNLARLCRGGSGAPLQCCLSRRPLDFLGFRLWRSANGNFLRSGAHVP